MRGARAFTRRARLRHDETLVRDEPRSLPGAGAQRLPSQVRRDGDEHEAGARAYARGLTRSLGKAPPPPRAPEKPRIAGQNADLFIHRPPKTRHRNLAPKTHCLMQSSHSNSLQKIRSSLML